MPTQRSSIELNTILDFRGCTIGVASSMDGAAGGLQVIGWHNRFNNKVPSQALPLEKTGFIRK